MSTGQHLHYRWKRVRVQAVVEWSYENVNEIITDIRTYTLLSDVKLYWENLCYWFIVILIVEHFGTHYMEFFVRMWFIFRYLI